MNTVANKRVQATQKKIEEAFFTLLEESKLDGISVKAICEKAKVNRSTFYEHYDGVNDLLDKVKKRFANEHLVRFSKLDHDTYEFILSFLAFLKENKRSFVLLVRNTNLMEKINEACIDLLLQTYEERHGKIKSDLTDYAHGEMVNVLCGFEMMTEDWLKKGCPYPEEYVLQSARTKVNSAIESIRAKNGN